jgi:hypothetical protein
MRSRTARLTLGAVSLLALGAAAFLFIESERQLTERRLAVRAFDQQTHEAVRALAEIRVGQQAYVAAGQGTDFWITKVGELIGAASRMIDAMQAAATSDAARSALAEASDAVLHLGDVDRRARDYLGSDSTVMAGDVVFNEGGDTAATAVRYVEAAQLAESQELDRVEAATRRRQAFITSAAGVVAVFFTFLLAAWPARGSDADRPVSIAEDRSNPMKPHPVEPPRRASAPGLKAAAELCTEIGRAKDQADLVALLGRAAETMDASGLIVWLGGTSGAELRPVLAHGYTPEALVRMPAVARNGDNAAAAAYRTGRLQIVLARPGVSNGALVAPLLTPDGCIGALTAEIKDGGETSDSAQSLAALLAAQLASVLAPTLSAAAAPDQADAGRAASM